MGGGLVGGLVVVFVFVGGGQGGEEGEEGQGGESEESEEEQPVG